MRETRTNERLFTFRSGGWVALAAILVCLGLLAWAVGPAFWRAMQRPPGDGRTIESYAFDLSTLTIPRDTLIPVMLHRDMVPVLTEPPSLTIDEARQLTDEERGKFLVSTDRILGVVAGGEARAYPIQLMTVHELVNDTLGDVPILVSYSWLGDIPRVYDRRVNGEILEFGISGLLTNANTLMYDRRPSTDSEVDVPWIERGESLWRQLDGKAVSGPAAEHERSLRPIHAQLVSWRQWQQMHPDTTVLARDPALLKRYRRSSPDQYFRSADLPYPVSPKPERDAMDPYTPEIKDRILAVRRGDEYHVWTYHALAAEARKQVSGEPDDLRTWHQATGEEEITLMFDPRTETFAVQADANVDFVHCFWFLWYAHRPETVVHETADARPQRQIETSSHRP